MFPKLISPYEILMGDAASNLFCCYDIGVSNNNKNIHIILIDTSTTKTYTKRINRSSKSKQTKIMHPTYVIYRNLNSKH